MDGLVEWRITTNGWVQVYRDPTRAGTALLNFAVDDLDRHRTALDSRGLTTGPVETASKDVRLSTITDPDGNRITFIGNFRTDY
ncbi:VOC family protein [Saccharopolyspora erythraea]|uniref:VOC family protein n=1 Tax=Saccharopolyspora erythraea TaxID=1836 RepID=UPI002012E1F9|nr:VOC family protein [Saccharopolyspora erythraea]